MAAVVGPGANVVILNAKNGNELNFKELPDGGNTHDIEVELENGSLKPGFILNANLPGQAIISGVYFELFFDLVFEPKNLMFFFENLIF